jgi:hypothetical protein
VDSPQSWNRFSYVSNNPIRFNDPSGHVCSDPENPNPSCEGSANQTTRVGDKMIRGNGKNIGGCGGRGQLRCGIQAPKVYGPTKPPYNVYNTEFQMFQATEAKPYSQVAEEGFTDYPGGGSSDYIPQPYGVTTRMPQPTPADGFGLLVDILFPFMIAHQMKHTPYDQDVYLQYTTSYLNIPRIDATRIDTLTNLTIVNSSDRVGSVINYTVSILSVDGSQIVTGGSAAPGKAASISIPSGLNIYNGLGYFNIAISATTKCAGDCITTPDPAIFNGAIRFQFTP